MGKPFKLTPLRRTQIGGLLVLFFLFFAAGIRLLPASPERRVEREHGVTLPASARVLSRSHSGGWLDGSAEATIFLSLHDLHGFLAQLRPGPPDYLASFGLHKGAWQKQGKGERWYFCHSNKGDLLGIGVGPAQENRVKIQLITSWD